MRQKSKTFLITSPAFMLLLLLLLLLAKHSDATVLTCEAVTNNVLNFHGSSVFTQFVCIVPQENFTKWNTLNDLYLQSGTDSNNLTDIVDNHDHCITTKQPASKILSKTKGDINCTERFSVILLETDPKIIIPLQKVQSISLNSPSYVFISPRTGMWIKTNGCFGNGNISIFTGAGSGEQDRKYLLRSWPCSSVPSLIISFDHAITMELDEGVTFDGQYSSTGGPNSTYTALPGDKIAILSSGRSDNLQNKLWREIKATVKIENRSIRDVDVSMEISFDKHHTKSKVIIQKQPDGTFSQFSTGTYKESFITNYLEVRYIPHPYTHERWWNNDDTIIAEISIGNNVSKPCQPCVKSSNSSEVTQVKQMLEALYNIDEKPLQLHNLTVDQVHKIVDDILNPRESAAQAVCITTFAILMHITLIAILLICAFVCVVVKLRKVLENRKRLKENDANSVAMRHLVVPESEETAAALLMFT